MAKFIRYSLATFCFAASVGCLALWWRSIRYPEAMYGPAVVLRNRAIYLEFCDGYALTSVGSEDDSQPNLSEWQRYTLAKKYRVHSSIDVLKFYGEFAVRDRLIFFPLWYPALIFAIAGVASLRLGRRFTIRSAIIATTVVAGLLGMAVGM